MLRNTRPPNDHKIIGIFNTASKINFTTKSLGKKLPLPAWCSGANPPHLLVSCLPLWAPLAPLLAEGGHVNTDSHLQTRTLPVSKTQAYTTADDSRLLTIRQLSVFLLTLPHLCKSLAGILLQARCVCSSLPLLLSPLQSSVIPGREVSVTAGMHTYV